MDKTFEFIKRFAAQNPYGFTISLVDFSTPNRGYCVAMKETQNSFGDEGLRKALSLAKATTQTLGGWLDERSGLYYFDCVAVLEDEETARRLALENEQLAFYCIHEMREVRLD